MNTNIINAVNAMSAKAAAKKAAEDAYKESKVAVNTALREYLENAPEGTEVLNVELARAAGLNPGHMASIIEDGYGSPIMRDSKTITTHFAEVDAEGKLVEGGQVKAVTRELTVYTKRNPKRRW